MYKAEIVMNEVEIPMLRGIIQKINQQNQSPSIGAILIYTCCQGRRKRKLKCKVINHGGFRNLTCFSFERIKEAFKTLSQFRINERKAKGNNLF